MARPPVILPYQPLKLRGVEAGAGFLHAGQVAMAQHRADGWEASMKLLDEPLHRLPLRRRARVGDATRGGETALVTDAYRMGVVAEGVGTHALHGAARMHHAIQRDVEVIANVFPAIHLHIVVAQLLHRISAIATAAAAMHHYHVYLSHKLCSLYLVAAVTPRAPRRAVNTVITNLSTSFHFCLFFSVIIVFYLKVELFQAVRLTRAESPEAPSPGHRPGLMSGNQCAL